MKKITKKQSADFQKKAMDILSKFNPKESDFYRYSVDTELGELLVRIDEDNVSCYSIFTRFEDVDKAKEHVNCNPYSGKHNFHCYDKETILAHFKELLTTWATPSEGK